jgi:acetyl-CoA acyltransferase
MTGAFIVDAVRTPVAKGKVGGAYADIHPVDLHAHVLRTLVDRVGIDPVRLLVESGSTRSTSQASDCEGGGERRERTLALAARLGPRAPYGMIGRRS